MTAVASPTSYQTDFARNAWPNENTQLDLKAMTNDEVSRMFVRRSNSSSSIASNSSATTISANGNQSNGVPNGEGSQVRKKPARGPWPSSKAEPVAGLSTARSHYVAATPSGPSAASAISALHTSSQGGLQQHAMNAQSQPQTNGYGRTQQSDVSAALWLLPMNGTFERKTIDVPFHPDILKIGRQTNAKTLPTPLNGYFDSKVLSRQHAEIWAERDGKIWIRDIRSSNGTFVNSKRLSLENRDSEPHPLKDQDILELGIDIVSEDGRSIVHHKVAARVEHAGIHNSGNNGMDFGNANSSNEPNPGQRWTHDWRNRNNSQGSIAGARSANTYPNGSSAAAYHSKWLQPVTMEQIVKKLKVELRDARLQAQNLHHTTDFVDAVLSNKPGSSPPPIPGKVQSPSSGSHTKSRFSAEPPAPPPSQPLPEKPNTAPNRPKATDLPALQPFLRRSDTEKPLPVLLTNGASPTQADPGTQVSTLREALDTAQREINDQSERLKDMEETLRLEREARNSAEKRADRLGGESSDLGEPPVGGTEDADTPKDTIRQIDELEADPASNIHQRFDVMRTEMDSMRVQVEKFRQRAEAAEEDSQRDRQTLAEMVATIRKRDEVAERRRKVRSSKHANAGSVAFGRENTNSTTNAGRDGAPLMAHNDLENEDDEGSDEADADLAEEYKIRDSELHTKMNGHSTATAPTLPLRRRDTAIPSDAQDRLNLAHASGTAAFAERLRTFSAAQLDEVDSAVRAMRSALESDPVSGGAVMTTKSAGETPLSSSAWAQTHDQLLQSAPMASMLGVVLLGVGMMAYLNGWARVVER